jgi:hypothetical protein
VQARAKFSTKYQYSKSKVQYKIFEQQERVQYKILVRQERIQYKRALPFSFLPSFLRKIEFSTKHRFLFPSFFGPSVSSFLRYSIHTFLFFLLPRPAVLPSFLPSFLP